MAYTRPWTNNSPLGSRSAAEIDDSIRELRVDVSQRMDDLTAPGGEWTANDPIVIPSATNGFQAANRYTYNDNLAVASKVSDGEDIQTLLAYQVNGQLTNGASQIVLNFGGLQETYDLNDINFESPVKGCCFDVNVNDFVFLLLANWDPVGFTATFYVRQADGGAVNNHAITGIILFQFTDKPVPVP